MALYSLQTGEVTSAPRAAALAPELRDAEGCQLCEHCGGKSPHASHCSEECFAAAAKGRES